MRAARSRRLSGDGVITPARRRPCPVPIPYANFRRYSSRRGWKIKASKRAQSSGAPGASQDPDEGRVTTS